jgi:hypothetical protein
MDGPKMDNPTPRVSIYSLFFCPGSQVVQGVDLLHKQSRNDNKSSHIADRVDLAPVPDQNDFVVCRSAMGCTGCCQLVCEVAPIV